MRARSVLVTLLLVRSVAPAEAITVLTAGKEARFTNGTGVVRVGRDPHLASGPVPSCPATSAVELSSYPEPTQRVVVEDAPAGVGAGRAAGARVLAVMTTHTAD